MPVTFPTSLDTTTFPAAGTMSAETLATEPHSKLHGDLGTAILHLETKLGIDSSADTNSIDYKVNHIPGIAVGVIFPFAGATPPTQFLICNGASVATTGIYANLFAVIAYAYGGSGASFNLPDLRGRALVGLDNMGGSAANRVTAASSLGQAGGEATHLLTTGELPQHTHTIDHDHPNQLTDSQGSHTHAIPRQSFLVVGGGIGLQGLPTTSTTDNGGSDLAAGAHQHNLDLPMTSGLVSGQTPSIAASAHNVLQPYIALNYIIRY